ncbi:nitroreductase family protein [bacterium]|jgi:nitroreductase|nr:nitroreductase family protein [bacterium]
MEVLEAIRSRRAVKHFDPNHVITKEERRILLESALQAPTSFNIQHWRVVEVSEEKLREQIYAAAWNQAQVKEASLLFVICADLKAYAKEPARYWQNAPSEVQEMLVPMIEPFYDSNERLQRDEAMRSVGIFAQTLMLAAKGLGYDSCPMIGFDAESVAKCIQLPDDHAIGMMLTVGKALKPAWPKPGQLPLEDIFIENMFS